MSNLIKYNFVNLKNKEVYIIDPEKNRNVFTPFSNDEATPLPNLTEDEIASSEEFDENLNVIDIKEMMYEERKKLEDEAAKILEEAREQARVFIEDAQNEADDIRSSAHDEGFQEGMAAGKQKMEQESSALSNQLQDEINQHEKEYNQIIDEIEPKYVDVVISLVNKITGVLLEDRSDVILYLIKNSVKNLDKATHYKIRTSSEDSYLIDSHKNEIREIIPEEASVEFLEEKNLGSNECIIETDTQMVDCGILTQLKNLEETLRMMVS